MKTSTLLLLVLTSLVFSSVTSLRAQVKTTSYYYNNFDGGTLGTDITQIGANAGLSVSSNATNNLATTTGHCLQSSGSNTPSAYKFSFVDDNTNLNNEDFGWEWTFLYKNSSNTADQSDVITTSQNAWKYWFLASGTRFFNCCSIFIYK